MENGEPKCHGCVIVESTPHFYKYSECRIFVLQLSTVSLWSTLCTSSDRVLSTIDNICPMTRKH